MKNKAIRDKISTSVSLLKSIQKKSKVSKAGKAKKPVKDLTAELETVISLQKEVQKLKDGLKKRKKDLAILVKKIIKGFKRSKKSPKKEQKNFKDCQSRGRNKEAGKATSEEDCQTNGQKKKGENSGPQGQEPSEKSATCGCC